MKDSSYLLSVPSRLPSRHQQLWNLPFGSSPSLSTLFLLMVLKWGFGAVPYCGGLVTETQTSPFSLLHGPPRVPSPVPKARGCSSSLSLLHELPPSSLLEGMRLNRCKAFIGAWHMVDNHCLQISFLRSGNFELVSTELYWLLWLSTAIQEWYFRHELFWYYWLNL